MSYRVTLPEFCGPLDLLLYLVRRNEVDVRDIPVAVVAEQFRAYLDILQVIDVDVAGDFLVMAATLMEIKSKMLLPAETIPEPAEDEDPRRELVKQLLEYKKFKDAAARLETRGEVQQRRLARGPEAETPTAAAGPPPVRPVELWDLVSAFGRIIQETKALQPEQVVLDDTPLHVYRDQILARLAATPRLAFRDLFNPPYHRSRLIGLFLALLELIKDQAVRLDQPDPFGEIWLFAASAENI